MKYVPGSLLLVGLLAGPLLAQPMPPPPDPVMPKSLPMQSILYDAEVLATSRSWGKGELQGQLALREIRLSEDGLVHVTIVGPEDQPAIPVSTVAAVGGRDDVAWRHQRDAWVPVLRLTELARSLPPGHFLQRAQAPDPVDVSGEGPMAINSDGYRDGGGDGSGLTVAIIDMGFDGLTEAWENGDIPSPYVWVNYTPYALESVTSHGTGCLEQAFDHAPGAAYRIYMIDSSTDMPPAVVDAYDHGVDVISMSLNWKITGWEDDSGVPCAAVNWAAANGMLVYVAAGNFARCHWQGLYNPGGGSPDWHDYYNGDESVDIVITDDETVSFGMQWNTAGGTYDYDLYLYDSNLNVIVASTNPENYFEEMSWTNTTGVDQLCHLCVKRYEGGVTEFEIFTRYGAWQEYDMAWSSASPPNNATSPNVITVGAIPWGDYGSPNGSYGILADYSGQGPSNGGMSLPDICAPTNVTCFTYPSGMGGTSCSTPNAAGATAAFWSADLLLHLDAIRWLILEQAGQWRDWGDPGPDLAYGRGGMILYEFAPHTLWVARSYGNVADDRAYPLYTLLFAHYYAETGGRLLLFPGGLYPEPVNLSRQLTVESTGPTATLGQ